MSFLYARADRVGLFPTKQQWFWRWAIIRLGVFLVLGHWYDMFVFQDVSRQLASGHGVYAISSLWLAENGDGYYAYPPVFAYFLALAGLAASLLGGHWYIYHIAIKLPLLAGDLATFLILRRIDERAAQTYWTLWYVPLLAIAQIQPDIWAGLLLLIAYLASKRERWNVAGGLIGLAAAIKFIPAVVIPFILVYLWRRSARSRVALFAAYALGAFIAAWLPYVLIYHDAWQFRQVLEFHASRTGGGLNLITPITSVFHLNHLWKGALGDSQSIVAVLHFVSRNYILVTASVMVFLFISAMARSWTLERSFLIPMVGMLISNRLVHEQYFMQVLPLALIAAPELATAVFWPFSIFVLAAGTPLRFIPREINPIDLGTIGTNMITGPILTFAVGLAAVMFVIRLTRGCVQMLSLRPNPLLRIARKALVPLAAVLVLLIIIIQRPTSTAAIRLEPHPGLDVLGNGKTTLLPVYVHNTTDRPRALKFVIGHGTLQTVWLPVDGGSTVIVPPSSGRIVHLYPRQFDRGIPINASFRLTAIATEEDLAARVSIKAPHTVSSSSIWLVPGLPSPERLRGNASMSRGVGELASISIHCVEQHMALRMTVKRGPEIGSEWTAAEIKFELDPLFVRRIIERGFAVWLYDPIAYRHDLAGWPTALQSVEFGDELESTLTIAFSREARKSFDLTASRRVVVLPVPHGGWRRVDFELAQHAADLGWTKHSRLTLSFITAAHYRAPGLYEANFGVVNSSGGLSTCGAPEASQGRTPEK